MYVVKNNGLRGLGAIEDIRPLVSNNGQVTITFDTIATWLKNGCLKVPSICMPWLMGYFMRRGEIIADRTYNEQIDNRTESYRKDETKFVTLQNNADRAVAELKKTVSTPSCDISSLFTKSQLSVIELASAVAHINHMVATTTDATDKLLWGNAKSSIYENRSAEFMGDFCQTGTPQIPLIDVPKTPQIPLEPLIITPPKEPNMSTPCPCSCDKVTRNKQMYFYKVLPAGMTGKPVKYTTKKTVCNIPKTTGSTFRVDCDQITKLNNQII